MEQVIDMNNSYIDTRSSFGILVDCISCTAIQVMRCSPPSKMGGV